jgi:hypothetical protein
MKTKPNRVSFDRLSNRQKEAIYRACERVKPEDGKPLSAADRRRHRRAGLRVGRPRIGEGIKRINISMEKGLLRTADTLARKRGISRARLIAESVKAFLAGAA